MKLAGWVVREDPQVPRDEVWFVDGQIVVGKIVGIHCPTTWERLRAWLLGLVGYEGDVGVGPIRQGLEAGSQSVRRGEHPPAGPPSAPHPPTDPHRW